MASTFGKRIKTSIFGQSHSDAVGVTIDGLPAGFELDIEELEAFLARRAPGKNSYSTKRSEPDRPVFLSGLVDGVTCGAPLTAIIYNIDVRSADYESIRDIPRPGHSDYTAFVKYGDAHDIRGGGHFSGRLTAPLCIAGGIAKQILRREGIDIAAHIASIGDVQDFAFDTDYLTPEVFARLHSCDFPTISEFRGEDMIRVIEQARADGDSVGGVIECAATGVPAGLGDPMFDGLENCISAAVFGIPGIKGIEFGAGFAAASMRGSEHNDGFYIEDGRIFTKTNNHGGILGGISSGMPVIFRAAVKPTPSIAKEQDSVLMSPGKNAKLTVRGRHDPCIVPRAVPCIEAAAALAIYDAIPVSR